MPGVLALLPLRHPRLSTDAHCTFRSQVIEDFDQLSEVAAAFPNLKTLRLGPGVCDDDMLHLEGLSDRLPSLSCLQLNACHAVSNMGLALVQHHLPA